MRKSLILALVLAIGSVVVSPNLMSQVHASGSPTVFISPSSTPLAPPNTLVSFNVSVSNMPTFGGWDIVLAVSDASVLRPVSIKLVETFGGTVVELSNCVNGVGLGCDTRDGAGVAHSAALSLSGSGPYDSGNVTLFTVTFNSTATIGYALLTLPSPAIADPAGNTIGMTTSDATYGNVASAPVAVFSWSPTNPLDGETVTFDASLSYDPSGGTIVSYHWIIDGFGETTNTSSTTFVFASAGDHTVSLTVTDDKGVKSLPMFQTVRVGERPAFEIFSSPDSLVIVRGTSNTSLVTLSSIGNFSGTVTLTVSVSPLGPTASVTSGSLYLSPNGQTSTTLLVSVGHMVGTGIYALKITGSSGNLSFYTIVGITVVTQSTLHRHQR